VNTPTSLVFDPAAYKATTRAQWDQAAAAWHRWGAALETWLGEATDLMLDLAGIGAGARVLDVAAGTGGQSIAAARRVGPSGAVLATDLSPAILAYAQSEAIRAGLVNVATRPMDGEHLEVDAGAAQLGQFQGPDGFVGPCELLVAVGRRPIRHPGLAADLPGMTDGEGTAWNR
jgi:SAM-dependent methyltransferase